MFDEPQGIRAHRACDARTCGTTNPTSDPPCFTATLSCRAKGLRSSHGRAQATPDPLTGELVPWRWKRNYGCNTPAASEHLLPSAPGGRLLRSLQRRRTGNFGGFRSSCTNNLIVCRRRPDAPEYTRTCTCAYQNQSSLALIHMPEAEMWTFFGTKEVKGTVKRLGLNFGGAGIQSRRRHALARIPQRRSTSPQSKSPRNRQRPTSIAGILCRHRPTTGHISGLKNLRRSRWRSANE